LDNRFQHVAKIIGQIWLSTVVAYQQIWFPKTSQALGSHCLFSWCIMATKTN
jgi:hypothetical protein